MPAVALLDVQRLDGDQRNEDALERHAKDEQDEAQDQDVEDDPVTLHCREAFNKLVFIEARSRFTGSHAPGSATCVQITQT